MNKPYSIRTLVASQHLIHPVKIWVDGEIAQTPEEIQELEAIQYLIVEK
jgi:hypothetical protein